jgi:hypothetical protein
MAKDTNGREGLTVGGIAKELEAKPGDVKKVLTDLGLQPDFVKGGCSYYYAERAAEVKKAIG